MKRWREKNREERGRGEKKGEERKREERDKRVRKQAYAPIHKRTYRFLIENKANNK